MSNNIILNDPRYSKSRTSHHFGAALPKGREKTPCDVTCGTVASDIFDAVGSLCWRFGFPKVNSQQEAALSVFSIHIRIGVELKLIILRQFHNGLMFSSNILKEA